MTILYINTGSSPNSGDGDTLRTAFNKVNANFSYLASVDLTATSQTIINLQNSISAVEWSIPTAVSSLTNDVGYLTSSTVNLYVTRQSGGRVLLQDIAVTSATTHVALTAFNNAVYLNYEIEVIDATKGMVIQMSTDGGATYDSGNNYDHSSAVWGSSGYDSTYQGENSNSIFMTGGSNGAPDSMDMTIKLYNPASTTRHKRVKFDGIFASTDGHSYATVGGGRYKSTSTVTAIQLVGNGGNIVDGRYRLYGILI